MCGAWCVKIIETEARSRRATRIDRRSLLSFDYLVFFDESIVLFRDEPSVLTVKRIRDRWRMDDGEYGEYGEYGSRIRIYALGNESCLVLPAQGVTSHIHIIPRGTKEFYV